MSRTKSRPKASDRKAVSRSRAGGAGARPASQRRKARVVGERKAEGNARTQELPETFDTAAPKKEPTVAGANGARIEWDVSNMRSAYANVCKVSSTREEVVMLFGLNQTWNHEQQVVHVRLSDRIVFSPTAGKRLALALRGVIEEYEKRWGALNA